MHRITGCMKAAALLGIVVATAGACGPCCQPDNTVSLVPTGIVEPPGPIVTQNPVELTTYVMMLAGGEAVYGTPTAQASVNGGPSIDLNVVVNELGCEGCVFRSQLVISGALTLSSGENEIVIDVHVPVTGSPDAEETLTIQYTLEP